MMMNMKINSPEAIRNYYRKRRVASDYLEERFTKPIYFVAHKRQVEIINRWIDKRKPQRILEIAPGPARIIPELSVNEGTAIDCSKEMLDLAKKRAKDAGKKWEFFQGDAFDLPFEDNSFDFIFSFRFIRHFELCDRIRLYKEIRRVLKDDGILAFDAINYNTAKIVRKILGEKRYKIYDELYKRENLIDEMKKNDFQVIAMEGVMKHFFTEILISKVSTFLGIDKIGKRIIFRLDGIEGKNPLEWAVICKKK